MKHFQRLAFSLLLLTWANAAYACPPGQSKGAFGWCYPNIGGEVGEAWEKGKDELKNAENDIRTWMDTGVCGGDICDIFTATVEFGEAQIEDIGPTFENAAKRLQEGKPIDAIWHFTTDPLKNTSENAAAAAQRSRVLAAAGAVAATVYGGPYGAAAYTAWLTYETTGDIGDAVRAGVIAGLTAAAIDSVNAVDLDGLEGAAARVVLTGAVSGTAVALSGGDEDDIRAAIGSGMTAAVLREGYRELTELDLDRERLRSSTGEAYCLNRVPTPGDFSDPSSCVGPRSAYEFEADGETVKLNPDGETPRINFKELDPDRPHVGKFTDGTPNGSNILSENSKFMTGVSRLPGMNAMAVGHDQFAIDMQLDIIPIAGEVINVGTIPPAIVLTYTGAGFGIQDAIRDVYRENQPISGQAAIGQRDPGNDVSPANQQVDVSGLDGNVREVLHAYCTPSNFNDSSAERLDLVVEVSLKVDDSGPFPRVCEIWQVRDDSWTKLGHAHHELNYCHRMAERIIARRQRAENTCYSSVGLRYGDMVANNLE